MRLKILFFTLLVMPVGSFAQDGIPYLEFRLRNSGTAIDVEWTVKAGNTCQDVEVWRGTDSLNLEKVFVYAGICGDNDSAKSYNYVDKPPVLGIEYYYQIVIITDRTKVKRIFSYPSQMPEVFPNPSKGEVRIVRVPEVSYSHYELFDANGRLIQSLEAPEVIEILSLQNFDPGIYLLMFYTADGSRVSKLLVE